MLLGLALGNLQEGIVDSYFGPPELSQEALTSALPASHVASRAADLRTDLVASDDGGQRGHWLDRQLLAVETIGRLLSGDVMEFSEEVLRCFDAAPEQTPDSEYAAVARDLAELLPGRGDLRDRLASRDTALRLPPERLPEIVDWLVDELRRRCAHIFPIPPGESLTTSVVTNEPWAAYNWYDGDLTSRVEVNTDLPVTAHQLIGTMAHETFPGHHLEHAWKEARLLREQGRVEASLLMINTPEAYISEGLAEVGARFVAGEGEWQALLVEVCARGDVPMTLADSDREWRISNVLRRLRGSGGDAALLLHGEGRTREEVIQFLEQQALRTREQAEHTLAFIDHPLWRAYVFCYAGGMRLLGRWIDAVDKPEDRRDRFLRLLTEQLTPSGIAAELAV